MLETPVTVAPHRIFPWVRVAVWIISIVLAIGTLVAVASLHARIATVVALGTGTGLAMALTLRPFTALSVLFMPTLLLAWLAFSTTWQWPIWGVIAPPRDEGLALAIVVWLLLGGLCFIFVLPYVVARLEGRPVVTAMVLSVITT